MSDLTLIIGTKTYSSWSLRGWLALHHTGLPFKEVKLHLDTPGFYTEVRKYTPVAKVPTLIHGKEAIWDSAAIIDYCARLAPEKFWWPEDLAAYGHARAIFNEMHSGFTAVRSHMPMNMRGLWQDMTMSEAVRKEVARLDALFTECRERFGKGGDFLFGKFSAADIMYAPVCSRLRTYSIDLGPVADRYLESVMKSEGVQLWLADALTETESVPIDEIPLNATHLG
jgi:glutathione S-transferase